MTHTFTEKDIRNKALLESMIREEADRIFESPKARGSRTLSHIERTVRIGKVAELWLIENMGYKKAPPVKDKSGTYRHYHDLIEPEDSTIAEVKAWTTSRIDSDLESEIIRIRTGGWNLSTWMIVFIYDRGTYTFKQKIRIRHEADTLEGHLKGAR